MRFLFSIFVVLFTMTTTSFANTIELINPYKGGSIATELYNQLTRQFESKNLQVKIINLDTCRVVPTSWKQYKNPVYISWSDSGKDCNVETFRVKILFKATQLFCSNKQIDLTKNNLKIGWQPSGRPLDEVYDLFEKRYGKIVKIPYTNSAQQIQGVIANEIDIALIGQGTAMTSNLNCFMSIGEFDNLPIFDLSLSKIHDAITAVLYENKELDSIINEFSNLDEIKNFKSKRKLKDITADDEKTFFMQNAFRSK